MFFCWLLILFSNGLIKWNGYFRFFVFIKICFALFFSGWPMFCESGVLKLFIIIVLVVNLYFNVQQCFYMKLVHWHWEHIWLQLPMILDYSLYHSKVTFFVSSNFGFKSLLDISIATAVCIWAPYFGIYFTTLSS
jgi:hypothetical protein